MTGPRAEKQRIAREALEAGASRREASAASGLIYGTVCEIARELGIPKGPGGPAGKTERNAEIAAEVATGDETLEEVGARWGLTRQRVCQIAKNAGVSARKGRWSR